MDALNDILGVDDTRVLNVNINKFSRNTKIQVIIDSKNGITVDECAKVSRITEDVIKLDDKFKSEYTLEVTSPGINRPLFLEDDYKDNIGSKVKVSLKKLQDKSKNISGIIMEVIDKFVVIKARNKSYKIEFENKNDSVNPNVEIKFEVSFLGFKVYDYFHQNNEKWINNFLVQLKTRTDKNILINNTFSLRPMCVKISVKL